MMPGVGLHQPAPVRWLAGFVLATLGLVELPYLLAFAQSARGWVFAGMIWSPHDFAQYASAMRQGMHSDGWLVFDHLSHEPHAPAFIYPFYVLLGRLAGFAGLDPSIVYHGAEVLGRAILLVALYFGTGLLFYEVGRRKLALAVIVFTSGLGAWMLGAAITLRLPLQWTVFTAADLSVPELSTFLVLFTAPHLMLGLAAIVVWARLLVDSVEAPRWRAAAGMAAMTLIVAVTNPFSLVTMLLIAAAYFVVTSVLARAIPWPLVGAAVVTAVSAAPVLAYNILVFNRDPFWGVTYGTQNILSSPPPEALLLAYGAPLVFAVIGAPALRRQRLAARHLIVVWLVLITVLLYLPVPFQRRFGFGLHPILALAATLGIERLIAQVRSFDGAVIPWQWRLARSAALLTLIGTPLIFYLISVRAAMTPTDDVRSSGVFHRAATRDVAEWLAQRVEPGELVLAETHTANYLGGWVLGRVYAAHWVATAEFTEKQRAATWFYTTEDADARIAFLENLGARYVVYGPRERALGGVPLQHEALQPVYQSAEVTIFEVDQAVLAQFVHERASS